MQVPDGRDTPHLPSGAIARLSSVTVSIRANTGSPRARPSSASALRVVIATRWPCPGEIDVHLGERSAIGCDCCDRAGEHLRTPRFCGGRATSVTSVVRTTAGTSRPTGAAGPAIRSCLRDERFRSAVIGVEADHPSDQHPGALKPAFRRGRLCSHRRLSSTAPVAVTRPLSSTTTWDEASRATFSTAWDT
jgi:hypothetical protein